MSRTSKAERLALTDAAHRFNTGRKQRPENLIRAAATRQARLTFAYPNETALLESLRAMGCQVAPQLAVGPYNVDIALEVPGIAVEIQSSSVRSFLATVRAQQRIEYILGQGWSILFVAIRGQGFVFPDVTQKVVAFVELAGRDKASFGQYGVIRSDGKDFTEGRPDPNSFTRVPGF
jgi:hypothetical protein